MAGILFDIVHPADVLFFKEPIAYFKRQGTPIHIASRDKDITCDLLDRLGLEHRILTRSGKGLVQLGGELVKRDWKLWRLARAVKPDVMVGFGGVGISHIGKLLRIPSISFYDTDHAPLQQKITLPFISEWHVPECYQGPIAPNRTYRFKGFKELSYFHPDNFQADRKLAYQNGLRADQKNFVVRVVGWGANHDVGYAGLTHAMLEELIEKLSPYGNVILSSEASLPPQFSSYLYQGNSAEFHHVLACSDLVIGESVTVATEATILGTKSLVIIPIKVGYVEQLAQQGIMTWHQSYDREAVFSWIEDAVQDKGHWQETIWQPFIQKQENISDYIIQQLEKHLPKRVVE